MQILGRIALGALLLAPAAMASAAAADWQAPGPEVGTVFPSQLEAPDQAGQRRPVGERMGARGVVVVFVRSADWCPFCKRQLAELQARIEDFRGLGYEVLSVSHDSVEIVAEFTRAAGIGYPMLADADGTVVESLGLRDTSYPPGTNAHGVPQPGLFVLDREGRVTGKHFVRGYRDRPDLDRVLDSLR